MYLEFIARTEPKGPLRIADRILKVETTKADEQALKDLQEVMELLKQLGYTIDK